jgi:hypothetical protein
VEQANTTFRNVNIPKSHRLLSRSPNLSIYNYPYLDYSEITLKSAVMSTGSSGDGPNYSSFDPNVLADGKRLDEWPGLKGQPSAGKMKGKDAVHEPEAEKQNKKANSTGAKSASLILGTHWKLAMLTFAVQV